MSNWEILKVPCSGATPPLHNKEPVEEIKKSDKDDIVIAYPWKSYGHNQLEGHHDGRTMSHWTDMKLSHLDWKHVEITLEELSMLPRRQGHLG